MEEIIRQTLEMFKLELETLLIDIKTLEEIQISREKCGEITQYVYLENTGLLKKELNGVNWVISNLSEDEFSDILDFNGFSKKIRDLIFFSKREANMPGALELLIVNRLEKVAKIMDLAEDMAEDIAESGCQ